MTPLDDFDIEIAGLANTIQFKKGQPVAIEKSHKYYEQEIKKLFKECGLVKVKQWKDENGYNLIVAEKRSYNNSNNCDIVNTDLREKVPSNIPSLDDWDRMWSIWDTVTLQMVSKEMMHTKPIDLR